MSLRGTIHVARTHRRYGGIGQALSFFFRHWRDWL